jgi:cobalamin synthase
VIGVALVLFVVEFVADKVPFFDNVWDAIHTFIRPPAAAILAYAAVAGVDEPWRIAAALIAGGVALTSHGTKASARAAVNTSPEPVSNGILSTIEDVIAIGLAWLAATHPVFTLVLTAILLALAIVALTLIYRLLKRVFGGGRASRPAI